MKTQESNNKVMTARVKKLLKTYQKKYGYTPTVFEFFNLYSSGEFSFSDENENALLRWFKENNLM